MLLVRRRDPVLLGDLTSRLEDMAGVQSSSEKRLRRYKDFLWTWEALRRSSGLRLRLNLKLGAARAPRTIQQKEKRRNKREESLPSERNSSGTSESYRRIPILNI